MATDARCAAHRTADPLPTLATPMSKQRRPGPRALHRTRSLVPAGSQLFGPSCGRGIDGPVRQSPSDRFRFKKIRPPAIAGFLVIGLVIGLVIRGADDQWNLLREPADDFVRRFIQAQRSPLDAMETSG